MARFVLLLVWNLIFIPTMLLAGFNQIGIEVIIDAKNIFLMSLMLVAIRGAFSITP
jgi:hypothetical protein